MAQEINDSGGQAIAVVTDVGDEPSVIASEVVTNWGRVDILFNNAYRMVLPEDTDFDSLTIDAGNET